MKYYSEDVVRTIYENVLIVGIDDAISKAKSIELPDNHGRLIDADAIIEQEKPKGISNEIWVESHIYKILNTAPTILEASNGTDN